MSFGIRIEIKDGTAAIASHSGHLPEGSFEINGHDHPENVQIVQRDEHGRYVNHAAHNTHHDDKRAWVETTVTTQHAAHTATH